jgi:hypothetical protein
MGEARAAPILPFMVLPLLSSNVSAGNSGLLFPALIRRNKDFALRSLLNRRNESGKR